MPGRCEELGCPPLALQVFANHSKYGVDLPDIEAARQLLHSLHIQHPIQDSITLSALLAVYRLPSISSDLVSCAMLTSACFKANTPESLIVADQLVLNLKELLDKSNPDDWRYPRRSVKRNQNKHLTWLTWTLLKVETALKKRAQPWEWLRVWRTQSGHVKWELSS